jgi:hypothetical protein
MVEGEVDEGEGGVACMGEAEAVQRLLVPLEVDGMLEDGNGLPSTAASRLARERKRTTVAPWAPSAVSASIPLGTRVRRAERTIGPGEAASGCT